MASMSSSEEDGSKPKRVKSALRESYNVVGLAGAAAASLALLNPLPLLVGLAAEAAYLLFVPDSKWYEARLSVRYDAEIAVRIERLREQVFPHIDADRQGRFTYLLTLRQTIGDNPPRKSTNWFREVVRKLDYLLEKWLLFADKEAEFHAHIRGVYEETPSPARRVVSGDRPMVEAIQQRFDGEIVQLTTRRDEEQDYNTQSVLDKRVDILQQRRAQIGRIADALGNLRQQMQLLEDSFALINDQIRVRPSEQIVSDVDGIVFQTDSMTRLLEDMAGI